MTILIGIAVLLWGGWWQGGLAASPAGAKTVPGRVAARPTAPREADEAMERAIRARLARSKIAANGFTVRVQGGVATLEGKTGIIQHKGTATRLARAAGAVQVVNRIEISEAARQAASANLAKGRRRAQVKRSESVAGRAGVPRSQRP